MDESVRRFRSLVKRKGLGRVGVRYPLDLRESAVAIARARPGEPVRSVALDLGLQPASLERWLSQSSPEPQEASFFRVEVAPEEAVEPAAGAWVVVMPSGVRVEGREASMLLELLRGLG